MQTKQISIHIHTLPKEMQTSIREYKGLNMKQVFKVIFITLLCTIGGVALFSGGAYLFGAFNEKKVYAENLYFNQTEVISAESFSLRIGTSTEGVTKKTVKLEAMQGGERIINFPETVTIGEDFFISPMTDSSNQNIGGVVELYCKYEEKEAPQGVIAKCKILIDVNVESCSVNLSEKQCKMNGSILVAEKNTNLSEVVDISPSRALNPYILKSSLNIGDSQGVFKNFSDKKIFLTLPSNAKFVVDGVEQTNILELPYTYDYSYNKTTGETKSFFTITSKIEIKPNENEKGEIVLKSFIFPTYKSQDNVIIDKNQDSVTTINLLEKTTDEQVLSSNLNLIVSDYEVENMTTNASTSMDINYGEEVTIYLNNPNAEKGSLNLGVQLFSTGTSQIDTFYFQEYVFVEVVGTGEIKSLKDSLCRLNGSTSEDGKLNVYYDGIDDKESTWCFKYKYSDFMAYYNYKNDNSDKNRIELQVWYQNNDKKIGLTSFYFIPKAREIESITTKYDSGEQFIYKSGSPLSLTKSNFNITYANSLNATFENLGYFIKIEDGIVFYPTKSGDYKAKFSFIPTSAGGMDNNSFSGLSSWCDLAESVVTLTQGNNSCTIIFDKNGSCTTDGSNISFEAGKKIDVEINSFKVTTPITQFDTSLFVVKIGQAQHTIKLKQVKFYDLTDNNQNTTPILIANDATIAGEYSFVTLDGVDYIYLNTTSDVILSGIASFNLVAMNIYQEDENVYFLGKSTNVGIYVYEEISSLKIYNYNTEEKSYSALPIATTQYEERSASGTLFITSAQLDTLSRLVELGQSEGKSRINFIVKQRVPDTLNLTDAQLSAVAEKNKNAITFGDLSPVYDEKDSTKLIGFTIPYTIGEFYTLKIEDIELYSTFDIKVQIEGADNATLIGQFVYEDKQEKQSWAISITDKVYKNVALTHGYSGFGTSKENPIEMIASFNSSTGDLVWAPTGASSLDKGVLKISYGYLGSDNKIVSSSTANCTTKIVSLDTQKILNPSPYCYYDNAQGGIVLKNVPYYTDGIIFKFQVYVSSAQKDNSNSYYAWRENAFVETLFSDLGENNGVSLYFKLTGLNIEITPNKNKTVDGISANTYSLFGDSGLFNVTISGNLANNYDLSKVLTCVLTSDMKKSLQLSKDYKTLTIGTNFLKDEECTFTFYVGQNSTDTATIKISAENNYTITIASALNINVTKQFTAPSTNVSFYTIEAKGGNATDGIVSSIALGSGEDFASVNDYGKLDFKTITGTKTITVILTLYYANDSSTQKTITYDDITVTSKYSDSELIVGTLDKETGEYYISAGVEYSVTNGGVSFTGKLEDDFNNISYISATFENATINEISHIASTSGGTSDFSFSSYDLNEDKYITITFTLTFNDGGQLVVTKSVKLKANLKISFASKGSGNYQSGNSIDLSDESNYIVTRNGEKVTDFSTSGYTMESFVYDKNYFYKPTTSSSDCVLCVRSASENLQAGNVGTTITFTYKVMVNGQLLYTLNFNLTLTINITTAG